MNFKPNSIRFWMLVVAGFAVLFGLLSSELGQLAIVVTGPFCGLVLYRRFRTKSFRGGVIGGVLGGAFTCFGAFLYIYGYRRICLDHEQPHLFVMIDACLALIVVGSAWGAAVGLIVMGLKTFLNEEDDRKRKQGKLERLIGSQAIETSSKR
jgi:hypothetical protein